MSEHDSVLRQTMARHFPKAEIGEDGAIALGFADVRMSCHVHRVRPLGGLTAAHLFFRIEGDSLAAWPVFASTTGYGDSPEVAIVTGACNWACAFGPVLRAGLGDEELPEVHQFDVTVEGQAFRVFIDHLDRELAFSAEFPPTSDAGAALLP